MDLIVDMWENLVIINWESIKLMGESFGDRCSDFDDLRIFNTYPIRD